MFYYFQPRNQYYLLFCLCTFVIATLFTYVLQRHCYSKISIHLSVFTSILVHVYSAVFHTCSVQNLLIDNENTILHFWWIRVYYKHLVNFYTIFCKNIFQVKSMLPKNNLKMEFHFTNTFYLYITMLEINEVVFFH